MGLTQVPKRGTGLGLSGTFPKAFEEASQHEPYNCKKVSSASSLRKHGGGAYPTSGFCESTAQLPLIAALFVAEQRSSSAMPGFLSHNN